MEKQNQAIRDISLDLAVGDRAGPSLGASDGTLASARPHHRHRLGYYAKCSGMFVLVVELLTLLPAHRKFQPAHGNCACRACASSKFTGLTRRTVTGAALASALVPAAASARDRTAGYEVQRTEREWSYVLSGQQYAILRSGGTEAPNSSPG